MAATVIRSRPCLFLAAAHSTLPGWMSARESFRELLSSRISPYLKSKGFQRRGYGFLKWVGKNCQLVYFGVNRILSDDTRVVFSVGLGTVSSRLWWFESGRIKPMKFPVPQDWHWTSSLAALVPDRKHDGSEDWWSIQTKQQVSPLADDLENSLDEYAFPALDIHVRDEALRDLYRSRKGGSEFQILYRLAFFLTTIGPSTEIDGVLLELRGLSERLPSMGSARGYAARIEALRKSAAMDGRQTDKRR